MAYFSRGNLSVSQSGDAKFLDRDKTFLDRLRSRDGEAFNLLVSTYTEMIYNVSLRMVKERELAEDLTQDVFIKIYRALPGFEGRSALSTWIYKIVYNVALAEMEKARYSREAEEPVDEVLERLPHEARENGEDSILGTIEKRDAVERLNRMMKALKPEQRWAMTLYYTGEKSYREIADIMDVPMGTVKTLLFRAKTKLREMSRTEVKNGLS